MVSSGVQRRTHTLTHRILAFTAIISLKGGLVPTVLSLGTGGSLPIKTHDSPPDSWTLAPPCWQSPLQTPRTNGAPITVRSPHTCGCDHAPQVSRGSHVPPGAWGDVRSRPLPLRRPCQLSQAPAGTSMTLWALHSLWHCLQPGQAVTDPVCLQVDLRVLLVSKCSNQLSKIGPELTEAPQNSTSAKLSA